MFEEKESLWEIGYRQYSYSIGDDDHHRYLSRENFESPYLPYSHKTTDVCADLYFYTFVKFYKLYLQSKTLFLVEFCPCIFQMTSKNAIESIKKKSSLR